MKNLELAKLGGVHFNTITKIRKMVGIEKMEKKKVEEWKKNQVFNEIGSIEFVDLMEKY
jgi:hypothetical protein